MKNPIVIQKRSAMGRNRKYQILGNDLIRRMSNISIGGETEIEEKIRVMNEYTEQLKSSGYNFRETAEVVKSGWLGSSVKRIDLPHVPFLCPFLCLTSDKF